MLALCADVARFDGKVFAAAPQWLAVHEVAYWAGPESLPLVAASGDGEHGGTQRCAGSRGGPRAAAARGVRSADVLRFERQMGLDRPRLAGLSPHRESELLAELLAS